MRTTRTSRGFTLVEIMVVLTIASVIAATVVPAIGRVEDARRLAATDEVARLLNYARSRATASGSPTGVRVDLANNALSLLQIDDTGAPVILVGPDGQDTVTVRISERFGAQLDHIEAPSRAAASDGSVTIWFDYLCVPHTRQQSGSRIADLPSDVTIRFVGGESVSVFAISGLVGQS